MWSKRACADIHKHQDESVEGEDGCICSLEVVFFFLGGGGGGVVFLHIKGFSLHPLPTRDLPRCEYLFVLPVSQVLTHSCQQC